SVLQVPTQIAVSPSPPAPATPHPQLAVAQKILVAFGPEAGERLGALSAREPRRENAQRLLVHLRHAELHSGILPRGLIDDARGRRVPEVAVLGAHDRRRDAAESRAAVAAEPVDRSVGALQPGRTDELDTGPS